MAKNNPKLNTLPTKAGTAKKILIVDDHPMMREGLRAVIEQEPDLTVCGVAENARQAMEAVPKLAPDLALVDITLPKKKRTGTGQGPQGDASRAGDPSHLDA